MKNKPDPIDDDDGMLPEYDLSGGVRGMFYERYQRYKEKKARTVVVLDPDVAKRYPDSKSVNDALRKLANG